MLIWDENMLLEVSRLWAGYGSKLVVIDVDMNVKEREIVAILGNNGAGKSTLLNAICGILKPTDGSGDFTGSPITGRSPADNVPLGLR